MKKRYLILIIVVLSIIIIGFPILINNQIGNELKAEDWLSFLGSYGGALIGFLGIILTILYTKISLKEEKRLEVKPYIYFKKISYVEVDNTEDIIENYLKYIWHNTVYIFYSEETCREDKEAKFYFKLDNLGLGSMIDCKIVGISFSENDCYSFATNVTKQYIGTVLRGESIDKFKLEIVYNIPAKEFSNLNKTYLIDIDADLDSFNKTTASIRKNTLKNIIIEFEYKDILGNKYRNEICLKFYLEYGMSLDDEQGIILSDIEPRISIDEEKSKEKLIKKS
ncbi:hypothetical protein QYB57_000357 [Clostridium perfringens]|nr:hypothetical protein [Clostridium perfringens]ELC8406221.1 hypothetical protein [Clostridium perfringens]